MKTYATDYAVTADWLRSLIDDGCRRIVLSKRVRGQTRHVRAWQLATTTDAHALAEEIDTRMRDRARILRPTLFALLAFKPGSDMHVDRKIVRFEPIGAGPDTLGGDRTRRNGRGLVSQMMRHSEASARIFVEQSLAIVEQYKQILREREARLALLEEKYGQILDSKECLASMRREAGLDGLPGSTPSDPRPTGSATRATSRVRTLAIACVCAVALALAVALRGLAR
jgi:hypothetical protein